MSEQESSNQVDARASEAASSERSGASDDVLHSLADLEARLDGLKRLHAQTALRAVEQRSREELLAQRERELADRERRVVERDEQWQRTADEVREQQARLADLERMLEEQRLEMQAVRERLEADTQRADAREQQSIERERTLAARHESLAEAEAQVRSEQARLAVHESAIAKRERTVADAEVQLRTQRADLEKTARQQNHERAEAERFRAWEREQNEALNAREAELRDRAAGIEAREQTLDQRQAALDEREKSIHEREAEAERLIAEATARSERSAALSEQIGERESALLAEMERLDAARTELESQRVELEAARTRLHNDEETSRASLEAREAEVRAIETDLARRRDEIDSVRDQIERERAAVAEQQRTLIEQSRSEDESSAISTGRLEVLQIQIGEANARRAAAEAELAQLREEISELREGLRTARESPDRENLEREIAKRDHAILKLRERLSEFQAALERAKSATAPAGGSAAGSPALKTRRNRLSVYKSLLQQQARKIVAAQTALQKRHAECEQILQQRGRLAAAAQDLARRERRIESSKARSTALVAVLALSLSTGVLALLSWQITLRVWPGVYVARASIEADTHGRSVDPTQLDAWRRYHEDLVANPQFIDAAAERLNRRGYPSLGRGPDLAAKLRKDLYVQSADDGQLLLELRETGSDRCQAVLDTIVTTLKSVSEAGRDQRTEDFGVAIVQAARTSDRPVNEQTLMGYAGGLLAGGLLAVGLFGGLVWSRLAGSKRRFEQSQAVEEALSAVDWEAMEKSMREAGTGPNGPANAGAPKPAAKGKAPRGR